MAATAPTSKSKTSTTRRSGARKTSSDPLVTEAQAASLRGDGALASQRGNAAAGDGAGAESAEGESGGARPFWSGTITFGLVSIPVALFSGYRIARTSLRMLAPDHTPLVRRYFCPAEQRWVEAEELVRGYEIEPGAFVVVSDEELEALEPRKTRDIELKRFVPADSIPPLYYEHSYWLAPSGSSVRAYHLLAHTMEQGRKAGIATFVMRGKEHLVAILADDGLLRAETLRFADELRTPDQIGLPALEDAQPEWTRKIQRAIQAHTAKRFEPEKVKGSFSERLSQLVEKKRGQDASVVELKAEQTEAGGETIDLMAILKRSLAQANQHADNKPKLAGSSTHSKAAEPKSTETEDKPRKATQPRAKSGAASSKARSSRSTSTHARPVQSTTTKSKRAVAKKRRAHA